MRNYPYKNKQSIKQQLSENGKILKQYLINYCLQYDEIKFGSDDSDIYELFAGVILHMNVNKKLRFMNGLVQDRIHNVDFVYGRDNYQIKSHNYRNLNNSLIEVARVYDNNIHNIFDQTPANLYSKNKMDDFTVLSTPWDNEFGRIKIIKSADLYERAKEMMDDNVIDMLNNANNKMNAISWAVNYDQFKYINIRSLNYNRLLLKVPIDDLVHQTYEMHNSSNILSLK